MKTIETSLLHSENSFHPEFMPFIKLKVEQGHRVHHKAVNPVADGPTAAVHREVKGQWAGHELGDLHAAGDAGTGGVHVTVDVTG